MEEESIVSDSTKYPSTPHLPFSPCVHDDDSLMVYDEVSFPFAGKQVVITEKLDGGNTCIKEGNVYARTHSKVATHESFSTIKELACSLVGRIPKDIWLFGENLTAIHSIQYNQLTEYFYLFAIYDKKNEVWLAWDKVERAAKNLGLRTVPLVFSGVFDTSAQLKQWMERQATRPSALSTCCPEGFVIRLADSFTSAEFERSIAKFVRQNHIQTDATWSRTWQRATLVPAHTLPPAPVQEMLVASTISTVASAPPPSRLRTANAATSQRSLPKLVMLLGMPGSGKSYFSNSLVAVNPQHWTRVCQDDTSGREECERAFSRAMCDTKWQHVILDRCNAKVDDRKLWLKMAGGGDAVCVYFDVAVQDCVSRVISRLDHPTLGPEQGPSVVRSVARCLEPPTRAEGFSEVLVVRDEKQVNSLLRKWGVDVEVEEDVTEDPAALYAQCVQTDSVNLSIVCNGIHIDQADVLNVYVFGSRLWGNSRPDSDYDLVIVTKDKAKSRGEPSVTAAHYTNMVDAQVLTLSSYQAMLTQHKMLYVLTAYLPIQCVWQQTQDPSKMFKLSPKALVTSLVEELDRDLRISRKFLENGKTMKGLGVLAHTSAYLECALELLQTGRVTFHGKGHECRKRCDGCRNWGDVMAFVLPYLTALKLQLLDM